MDYQVTPYAAAMALTGAVTLSLAVYAFRRRTASGWLYFVLAMLAVSWWSEAYALELTAVSLPARVAFNNLAFTGAHALAPLWFLFSLYYLNRNLSLPRQLALFVLPAIMGILAFTNPLHGWVWTQVTLRDAGAGEALAFEYGPAFWVGALYAYSLMLAGSLALGRGLLRSTRLYRNQTAMLLAAAIIPWLSNFLYITGFTPLPGLDLTPPSFAVSGLLVTAALFRYRLLELIPIAYDALFASMENEVLVLDASDRLLEANPAARRLLNLSDAHIGQPVSTWLTAAPELMCLFEEGGSLQCEVCLETPTGQTWRDVQSARLFTGQQAASGRLIVLNDITERRNSEAEIRQAHQKAIQASQMKTRLLASVSHDLRTPMTAILGFTDMLRSGVFGEVNAKQRNALDQVLESANQQLAFINNLIGQAQLETGQVILNYQHFSAQDLLQPLQSTVGMMALRKNLSLVFEVDDSLPALVYGDPYWLRQVMLNLVNNAIKFTAQGEVSVRLFQLEPHSWSFQVQDSGVGIPADQQREIFEPFRQLKEGRLNQSGSGLGLAIVAQLVDLMQACIDLDSQPGRGSTFTVTLPYEPAVELSSALEFKDTAPVR